MTVSTSKSEARFDWKTSQLEQIEYLGQSYIIFSIKRPTGYSFRAGQYAIFSLTDESGSFERSYSIASSPEVKSSLHFCVQISGDGRAISVFKNLKIGTPLQLSPAQGTFKIEDPLKSLIFIAGGSGISLIRAFLTDLLATEDSDQKITLIYGCRDANMIPFFQELMNLSKKHSTRFNLLLFAETGQTKWVSSGNVIDALLKNPNIVHSESHYYLCGPPKMIQSVQTVLISAKLDPNQIFFERY